MYRYHLAARTQNYVEAMASHSVGDPWIGMALQQRRIGTTEQALQAYDGAFKRFAETSHSVPLHQEMRKSYTDLSECTPVDTTVATKLKAQRAFSAGMSIYSWHAQTFLLPADFLQFERTYKAHSQRPEPCSPPPRAAMPHPSRDAALALRCCTRPARLHSLPWHTPYAYRRGHAHAG